LVFLPGKHPVFPGYAGLPENPYEKVHTYFGAMRIRNGKNEFAMDHVWVFPAMERTIKSKGFQPPDKIRP